MTEQFANGAISSLAASVTALQTTISVADPTSFPTQGNFRIVVQSFDATTQTPISAAEIMLVTAVSGKQFTVTRAAEPIAGKQFAMAFASGAQVAHILTAAVMSGFSSGGVTSFNGTTGAITVTGPAVTMSGTTLTISSPSIAGSPTYNYYDYVSGVIPNNPTSVATSLQNFLLYVQLRVLALQAINSEDILGLRRWGNAYIPGYILKYNSPLIIPEYVNLISDADFIREGTSGTITNFYTGDTTSKALANLNQPTLITVAARSGCAKATIVCNSANTDRGTGWQQGKNWTVTSASLVAAGSGYSVNDILSAANPSQSPFLPVQIKVLTVDGSGHILTWQLTNGANGNYGAYALPPVLQAQQWTSANGFTVFDGNGNFLWTGGTGTGASFSVTWAPDFAGSAQLYSTGRTGLIGDSLIGVINSTQSIINTDATYGPTFCAGLYNLNGSIGKIETESGQYGIVLSSCTDMRIDELNPVNAQIGVYLNSVGSIECNKVIIDTPTGDAPCLAMDTANLVILKGTIFNRNLSNAPATAPAAIQVGGFTATQLCSNIDLEFLLKTAGNGASAANSALFGCAALSLANVTASRFNIDVTNYQPGYSGSAYPAITRFVDFGSNISADNKLEGRIDLAFGALTTGTNPGCYMNIWDAEVAITTATCTATITGSATNGDTISLTFSNNYLNTFNQGNGSALNVAYHWPRTISITVTTSETITQMAAALAAAINADAWLPLSGVIATSSSNIVTIGQMGLPGNSTTVTSATTGSSSEIVTLSNSGNLSGGISGGALVTGGTYSLVGSGPPSNGVMGTGWGKAPAASCYDDKSAGILYINQGNATSPNWIVQGPISLTTFGTSGAATLASGVLNIPQYSGSGGTVTSVAVSSANGLAGTVANATTAASITLSTTITGILQGNGTALSAAGTTGTQGNLVFSQNPVFDGTGAASTASIKMIGGLFTGGSGTTTFPYYLMQPNGATAVTTWNTGGTFFGINSATGFTGNFIDFHLNGAASALKVDSTGTVTAANNIFAGQSAAFAWSGRSKLNTNTDGNITISNNAGTGFGRLIFGSVSASFSALKSSGTTIAVRLGDDSGDAALTAGNITSSGTIAGVTLSLPLVGILKGNGTGAAVTVAGNSITLAGKGTLASGTATVSTTAATSTCIILLTTITGGTGVGFLKYSVTAGTSFTVTSSNNLDNSSFSYLIVEP